MKPVCIAIIDAANARLYSYQGDPPVFREILDLLNPGRRGTQFGRDDMRRAVWDAGFAKHIATECSEIARTWGFRHVIFVSTPHMLGELRKFYEPLRRAGIQIDELQRDLGGMTSVQIHDRLADLKLIDRRARAR